MDNSLELALKQGVFWITPRLAIGQFASENRAKLLLDQGITHVLNVSDCPSVISQSNGFREVVDIAIEDNVPIESHLAVRCLKWIESALAHTDVKVYVHCTAGQNRSPTIVWLHLLGTGMDEQTARDAITSRCPDAVPGHKGLVNEDLLQAVKMQGIGSNPPSSL